MKLSESGFTGLRDSFKKTSINFTNENNMPNEKKRGIEMEGDTPKEAPTLRKNHLLIIGIDDYQDSKITDLSNAKKDALDFKELMINKYQFSEENTTCLFDKSATRQNILQTFSYHLNDLNEEDNLLFYYSGHGEIVKSGRKNRGFWIPSDATADMPFSYVSNEEIINLFEASYAHHIFGIVDSCFSGSLFVKQRSVVEKKIDSLPSRWLLTAGLLEPVSDGSLGENSPFAKTLLTHLKANPDKTLWTTELCTRVLRSVEDNTKNQTPRGEPLHGVGHMGGQFIFRKKGFFEKVEEDIIETKNEPTKNVNTTNTKVATQTTITPESQPSKPQTTPANMEEWREQIKLLVAEDLGQAMVALNAAFNRATSKYNDLILLRARHNSAKMDSQRGVVTLGQQNMMFNQIRYALIEMVDDMEEDDLKHFRIQRK